MFLMGITLKKSHMSQITYHLKVKLLINMTITISILVVIGISIVRSMIFPKDLVTVLLGKIIFIIMTKSIVGNEKISLRKSYILQYNHSIFCCFHKNVSVKFT